MKKKIKPCKFEITHQAMVDIAQHLNRPEHYSDDLLVHDRDTLRTYQNREFVWILRSHGTYLFPLRLGIDPNWVEQAAADQGNYCFIVDSTSCTITKITGEKAVHLINQHPFKALPLQQCKLRETVNALLSYDHFGVFQEPEISVDDWQSWYEYFKMNNLSLMMHFMRKVIHHNETLLNR